MCIGAVVKSKTGRDRYRLYVIVGVTEDGRALISNGRLHTLEKPKKKNLRHLTVLQQGEKETSIHWDSDDALHAYLQDFEKQA